ncbi:hypothetical protein ATCCBAA256_10790 [Mycobacterium montefiorense]|nr:hypothetical protein ATCCBAA256_10790 [Mycobacterium montefiorense]
MADRIHVAPAHLREAAARHQEISEYLRTIPSSHAAIQESLDSLGPIFGDLRDAGRELLELRRQCYEQQADDHADMAHHLTVSASTWDQHEQDASGQLGRIVDGGRSQTPIPRSTPFTPVGTSWSARVGVATCTASRSVKRRWIPTPRPWPRAFC